MILNEKAFQIPEQLLSVIFEPNTDKTKTVRRTFPSVRCET